MEKIETALDDTKKITAIYWNDEEGSRIVVGKEKFQVTAIKPYVEEGKTWLAIFDGERITRRVPLHFVEICYEKGPK